MKRKIIWLCVVLGFVLTVTGCGGKYSDAVEVNEKFTSALLDYFKDLEKVDSADAAAKAINKFAEKMEKLGPEMKRMAEKYPELKDTANLPEEMKASTKEVEEASRQFAGSFMKMMRYMASADVQNAQMRLTKAMEIVR